MNAPKGYHRHPNGGGLVADTAMVHQTAYVSATAIIGNGASIGYRARIGDGAIIGNGASIGEKEVVPAVNLPPVGYPIHGWKKLADGCVAEIEVPADAERLILTPENVASPYALARALLDSAITVTSSPSDGTGGVYAIYRARVGDRSISLGAITIDEGFGYTEADARKALLDALLPAEATAP